MLYLRVEVGKRWGSTKLEVRGLFRGAKVIRRQDWKLNDQDSNSNVVGVVEEVFSSNNRDDKDSVRVSWNKGGQTNIYRVSKNGNMRTKSSVVSARRN